MGAGKASPGGDVHMETSKVTERKGNSQEREKLVKGP